MRTGQAPAPVWRPIPDALPLRAWSSSELAHLCAIVEAALLEWARAWDLPPALAAPVACTQGCSELRMQTDWLALGGDQPHVAWMRWSKEVPGQLAAVWFGAGAGSTPVVQGVAQACQQDAMSRLATALRLRDPGCASQPLDGIRDHPWSGAATMNLPFGGHLAMHAGVLQPLLRPPTTSVPAPGTAGLALVPIGDAIARTRLRLRIELEGCELGLGELQDLQPGDVLRLAHPVDAPASILHAPGPPLLRGWLARSDGRKAVELAPITAAVTRDRSAKELR